ncbi:hypothetical protein O6H91_17G083800 [Diphasiastrum complanatum]|uniref:Uncharacterized protein n=2 Tax=Diphasiastrum complanatum TaxID=34168 RepID=A0ACC2B8S2_DIPCM|nr:hypothetical protein O6H91_17G083100 [Diphasiastrum complanatum]KAJ7526141.1 hypothetical protein O6H91_17G083800 [Diphasiastrum complanatum]
MARDDPRRHGYGSGSGGDSRWCERSSRRRRSEDEAPHRARNNTNSSFGSRERSSRHHGGRTDSDEDERLRIILHSDRERDHASRDVRTRGYDHRRRSPDSRRESRHSHHSRVRDYSPEREEKHYSRRTGRDYSAERGNVDMAFAGKDGFAKDRVYERERRLSPRNGDMVFAGIDGSRKNRYSDRDRRASPSYQPYELPVARPFPTRVAEANADAELDSDSEDELKGLELSDYRRLKREKMRRKLDNCIWRVTPSPPRGLAVVNDIKRGGNELEVHGDAVKNGGIRSSFDEQASDSLSDEQANVYGDANSNKMLNAEKKIHKDKAVSDSDDEISFKTSDSDDGPVICRKDKKKFHNRSKGKRKNDGHKHTSDSSCPTESDESSEARSSSEDTDTKEESRKRRAGRTTSKDKKRKRSRVERTRRDEHNALHSGKIKPKQNMVLKENEKGESTVAEVDDDQTIKAKQRKKQQDSLISSSSNSEDEAKSGNDSQSDEEEKNVEVDEEAMKFKEILEAQKKTAIGLESEPMVGPAPAPKAERHISYGGALRPGEGDAIAQYVQQGKRIPRRGEVGLSADEISKFETLGYVMSGSRHQRMNAIRIRKENQVYSAEDKRALAMFNYEEKAKREHKVMSDLQRLVQRHIGQEVAPTHDPFSTKNTEMAEA